MLKEGRKAPVVGMIRSTFIVDRSGVVRRVFPRVRVPGPDAQVLALLLEL